MWRPLVLAGTFALVGCGSALPDPSSGFPSQVRSVRLFDGAGIDVTNHVFLYNNDTLHLEVRLYADNGRNVLDVTGGLEMTITFDPFGLAVSTAMPGEILKKAVTTNAPAGTDGSITVILRFLEDGSEKTFGPFNCASH